MEGRRAGAEGDQGAGAVVGLQDPSGAPTGETSVVRC